MKEGQGERWDFIMQEDVLHSTSQLLEVMGFRGLGFGI